MAADQVSIAVMKTLLADAYAVYYMYGADEDLLYIGVTGDAGQRFGGHSGKRWFVLVTKIELEWFSSRAAAEKEEAEAIRTLHPRYNITGVPGRVRITPRRLRIADPDLIEQLGELVSLDEAIALGVLSGTLASVRQQRHRDRRFPGAAGKRGTAFVYEVADLRKYERGRK